MSSSPQFHYVGQELDIFLDSQRWKAYLAEAMRTFIGLRVLEVGAGLGGMTRVLKRDDSTCWLSLEPDAELNARLKLNIKDWNIENAFESSLSTVAEIPDNIQFDTVLYIDVLEHIADDVKEILDASRHLDVGGYLIVQCPAFQWLYTDFDKAVGHYRRYTLGELMRLTPPGFKLVLGKYFDSFGMLASVANKVLLHSSQPTPSQVRFWDRVLVPISRFLDPLVLHSFGRSVMVVWRREY